MFVRCVCLHYACSTTSDGAVAQVRTFLESSKASSHNSQTSNFPESTFGKMFSFFNDFVDKLAGHELVTTEKLKAQNAMQANPPLGAVGDAP